MRTCEGKRKNDQCFAQARTQRTGSRRVQNTLGMEDKVQVVEGLTSQVKEYRMYSVGLKEFERWLPKEMI